MRNLIPLLGFVIVLVGCQTQDDGCSIDTDCKGSRICDQESLRCAEPTADSVDMAVPAPPDLGPPPDFDSPDLSMPDLARCLGSSRPCAGPGTVCDQKERCRPCGKDGQACCSERLCDSGSVCVGCTAASWGTQSVCRAVTCGVRGNPCCWYLEPGLECGNLPPREQCVGGATCVDHRCV